MNDTTTNFAGSERVTSVIHVSRDGQEAYSGPIIIGHYGPNGGAEVWIEQEGGRVNIPAEHFAAVMKAIKRAEKIAQEVNAEAA